jgi:hypothetical protein
MTQKKDSTPHRFGSTRLEKVLRDLLFRRERSSRKNMDGGAAGGSEYLQHTPYHTPNLRGAVLTSSILTLHWFVIMETESTSAGADTPTLFIHVRFEVPVSEADGGNKTSSDEDDGGGDGMDDDGSNTGGSKESVAITDQYFDASNCKPAVIGLPDGVEPIKVCLCACT